jgi:hypothetical protein
LHHVSMIKFSAVEFDSKSSSLDFLSQSLKFCEQDRYFLYFLCSHMKILWFLEAFTEAIRFILLEKIIGK